ncbi:MAG: hypothetical protein QOI95_3359 [Acidimicrobiaceae bacterium]
MTAASEPVLPPSLFDDPDTKTTTPGNGHGVVSPPKRHRFAPDEGDHGGEVPHEKPHELTKRERRQLGRLRARKVKRIVRHIDPWSVLKLSLLFYACLFVVFMVAGTLLWNLAGAAGTISSIESFIKDIGAFKTFSFSGATIFRATFLAGMILVIAGSGLNVLLTVLFNLISDLVGGIRVSVIEEETARPIASEPDAGRR